MEFVVRGLGLMHSISDLENIVVTQTTNGMPVYIKDVATVQLGGDFRRGALDVNGHEVVGGVVIMRNGENAMAVIKAVKEKIAEISPGLPAGVSLKPFYDRSDLISRTIDTLKHSLVEWKSFWSRWSLSFSCFIFAASSSLRFHFRFRFWCRSC